MSNDNQDTVNFVIGPFTKENFNVQKWKYIKDKIYHLNSTNEEESMPYCQEFLQLLIELNAYPDYNQYFGDPSIKAFFFQEFFGHNAKNLIATRTFQNGNLLNISNECLQYMITFWVKAFKEENPHLVEMAKIILDPTKYYYKCNDQEFFSPSVVPSFHKEATHEHLEWIDSLKEGDLVDCIKEESTCHRMCWLPARVSYVMDSFLKISFLYDPERANKYLNKVTAANEIAPHKTKCADNEWRVNLKKGDEIDVCNTSNVWCHATVADVRESQTDTKYPVKEIFITYNKDEQQEKNRSSEDEYRQRYEWTNNFDEWLVITNPRIARKDTLVRKVAGRNTPNDDETIMDDSNDLVYSAGGERIYALTRQLHCKSTTMVKMINEFGRLGGFKMILERIKDTQNWAPIELVSLLLTVLGQISTLLHREFVQEYIPALKEAVWKNLLQSPDSNIRNFTKERLDDILQALDNLLKRIYPASIRHELLETLNLEVCAMCFDSNFLERKIQGLKSLLEMIKCLKLSNLKHTTNESLNEFIKSRRIFEKIYGSKGHTQLIQRSADFLKYIVQENNLEQSDLENIWNATKKGDTETKLSIIKLFSEISIYFKEEHLDFIVSKVAEIEPSEMISEEIEMVYELIRFSSKPSGFAAKARAFFWKVLSDISSDYPPEIVELILSKFCTIMRSWDQREERLSVLYDCVDNIQKGVAVLPSLKVLHKIIENYPTNPNTIEKLTKSTCVQHLFTERNLFNVLLQNLKEFKESIKKKLATQPTNQSLTEELLDQLAGERASYITHITERLQFIHFVVSHSGSKEGGLGYELLSELWEIVVRNALIPSERNAIYKWVKETAESKSGFSMPMQDLVNFFKTKMVTKDDYQVMTSEGFECFKSIFLLANEKLGGLSKVSSSSSSGHSNSYGPSYGPVYGPVYMPLEGYGSSNYGYDDDKGSQEKDFEYKVNISPEELEGIQSVWDLSLNSKSEEVAEKAREFVNELYLHLNNDLEEQIVTIRGQYLNKCIESLKKVMDKKNAEVNKDLPPLRTRFVRCLSLICKILDESEKKGVGSLKSHSGLVKGELITFFVTNEVTWGTDVPRKLEIRMHSNVTVYELRAQISEHFKVTWDQIKLFRSNQKEIKDNENGKTLGDIRIRNSEELTANKRHTKPLPQADLTDSEGNLNPLAKKIFVEWFNEYSTEGKMNIEQCAGFINSCTNDGCKSDDRRVKEVFTNNDHDRDGFLTLDDFLEFYGKSCRHRPQVVWNNLHAHHYRNDLKKASEVEEERIEITSLPRYILSTNTEYFHLLFSLLGYGDQVAIEAWKLLNRLPTSPQIFADIVQLKGVRDVPESEKTWRYILDSSSSYKLLYALHVIEYLMEDEEDKENKAEEANKNVEGEDTASQLLWSRNPELVKYKKTWQTDFIYYKGFDHLFQIFNSLAQKNHQTRGPFDKNILSFILKILSNYLTATFAGTVPNIYRNLSFIRFFHLNLNFIQDYITNDQKKIQSESNIVENPADQIQRSDSNAAAANRQDGKSDDKTKENLKIEESQEFKALVEKLQGELGAHIISTINLKEMIRVISELGCDLLSQDHPELESEDSMILEYSLIILVSIFLYDNETVKHFLSNSVNADKFVLKGIFCNKSFSVRNYFSHAIYVLCKSTTGFDNALSARHFTQLFLKNLPSSKDTSKEDCNQYFEVLCKLIEETYSTGSNIANEESLNFEELIEMIVKQIKEHTSSEDRRNFHIVDKAFTGLLQLCEKLVAVKPDLKRLVAKEGSNLIEEVFNVCLFNTRKASTKFGDLIDGVDSSGASTELVKCKSKESRQVAYQLLLTLCKGYPSNLMVLLKCLEGLMESIADISVSQEWSQCSSSETKSLYGYVGIKNLKFICYMNAMLQQFFMTPTFRYSILAADDKQAPNWVKTEDGLQVDDNVLHQLQKMFGFLELSDRQDYNPQEFCFSFKDHAGQPVNVGVQQDTQEFLNMVFDKLENGLKNTPFKNILEGVYGGKTSNQMICHGCGNIREREDIFYNLSVEVRNMKNIYDSFEKFITGEIIEDFHCDHCKTKNSITKRSCLSALPNVLIVHLQRIVFDLDTLMNQKINSRLEFPLELNVEPYTREALQKKDKAKAKKQASEGAEGNDMSDELEHVKAKKNESESIDEGIGKEENVEEKDKDYYTYRLGGVLIHEGTADFGHYYSYINTNRGDTRGQGKGLSEKDKWLEYNDSTIRSFNLKTLESECFGGETTEASEDYWTWGKSGRENSKNAYILVYERVIKDPLKLVVTNAEDEAYLKKVINVEEVQKKNPEAIKVVKEEVGEGDDKKEITNYYCDYYMLNRMVPASTYQKVWEDNNKFMFERHINSEDFFNFVKEVCSCLQLPETNPQAYITVHPQHNTLSQETKQNVQFLIQILSKLIFGLLAKAQENNIIGNLAPVLRNLLSVVPEAAYPFFESLVIKDTKSFFALFLTSSDKMVRYHISQLVLHSINVMVSYYNFTLDSDRLQAKQMEVESLGEEEIKILGIEHSIIKFLDLLIASMPTEVAKNWLKLGQFFEFWRAFSLSGEPQMRYLFQREFIAVLIDFFLDKKSPLVNFSDKKHSLGNRYTEPEFNSLVQTVANMVLRAKIITRSGLIPYRSLSHSGQVAYELSDNDLKCLTCPDFYEKAIKEKYDCGALGSIIQQFCTENESLSWNVSGIIIAGLNKASYEEARPYLEAMSYLITLGDNLQHRRLEWILGFPQPMTTTMRNGHDSFGLYGNYSLDDVVVNYETPLGGNGNLSVINVMLQNRKRLENMTMVCLKQILLLADINDVLLKYLISLPPPSYNFAKFTDWIPVFIDYFLEECKKYYYSTYSKEEIGLEGLKIWRSVEAKINQKLEIHEKELAQALGGQDIESLSTNVTEIMNTDSSPVLNENENYENISPEKEKTGPVVLKGFFNNYIIGKTYKIEDIDKVVYSQQDPYEIMFKTSEAYCYITDSKPTGNSNLAFPGFVVDDCTLKSYEVKPDSPLSLFIQGRHTHSSMDPHKNIQSMLQNDIEAALAQASESTQSNTSGSSPNQYRRDSDVAVEIETNPNTREVTSSSSNPTNPPASSSQRRGGTQNQENVNVQNSESPKQPKIQVPVQEKYVEIERNTPVEQDFDFTYEINPVVRRIYLMNESPYSLDCQLGIAPKNGGFLNFRIPSSMFSVSVRPHSTTCILTLTKVFPQLGWGEYELKYYIQATESDSNMRYEHHNDSSKRRSNFYIHTVVPNSSSRREVFTEDRLQDLYH